MYQQLQGDSEGMFDVSAGLLLDKIQHEAYDTLKWSLYRKVWSLCVAHQHRIDPNRAIHILCITFTRPMQPIEP